MKAPLDLDAIAAGARLARALALLVFVALLASCGGDNWFDDPGGVVGPNDRTPPQIRIVEPEPGQRIAVGDSIFVRLEASDDVALDSVVVGGYSLRGNADLGTETRVFRFETRAVDFGPSGATPRDTIITRYLIAAADTLPEEPVYIVARAVDAAGNEGADTVAIGIGGPRVSIGGPLTGSSVRAGADLMVRVTADDPLHRLASVRLLASGDIHHETLLTFEPPRTGLDTVLVVPIPQDAGEGGFTLRATARNTLNDSTSSAAVRLALQPAEEDAEAPRVRFSVNLADRSEQNDSVAVTVVATDETRLDLVGALVRASVRTASGFQPVHSRTPILFGDSATFRFSLAALGAPVMADTATVRLEVTAFAIDAVGNCATATVPEMVLSEECGPGEPVAGVRPGARVETLLVRGRTLRLPGVGDRIADIAADDEHLFLSNITRNRLEVLPLGATQFSSSVAVGSRPWGLAFDPTRERLYVANSGGTNISVVSPSEMQEVDRILTPNVKLFDVTLPSEMEPGPPGANPLSVSSVVRYDYSDRPQFIGVTQNENLYYSTLPTRAASDGTLRRYDRGADRLEIITDYAEERIASKVVIVNADSAFHVPGDLIRVCPRDRSLDPQRDRALGERCFTDTLDAVADSIGQYDYDTRILYGLNIEEVGLTDTTFVAVSGDHRSIAFGEGGREHGRVMLFGDEGAPGGSGLVKYGEIFDLVGNAAERVIGLGLNADGSLGVARGIGTYFFSGDLRLQGEVLTDPGGGGVDMLPGDPSLDRALVSGVQPDGLSFVDVVDTFHFGRVTRIFLRDPVTGPLRIVSLSDGSLLVYAVTTRGLVAVPVYGDDL